MKKVFAIVALIAAMFVAGNAQAQIIAYLGLCSREIQDH